MSDYIKRNEAVESVCAEIMGRFDVSLNTGYEIAEKALDISAADVVEVVRCKDCEYNSSPPDVGNAVCDMFYGMTDQEGFCHYGERKK